MTDIPVTPDARRRRPFGVYAIVFLILLTIPGLFLEQARIGGLGPMSLILPDGVDPRYRLVVSSAAAGLLAVPIAGFFFLKRWAWVLGMILVGVWLSFNIWLHFHGRPQYLEMLVGVVLVFYLNQRDVQQAFRRRKPPR